MISINISNYSDWAASGWKTSLIRSFTCNEVTRIQDFTINSSLNGWAAFTQKEDTTDYGQVTVCDFTNDGSAKVSVVWNAVTPIAGDAYDGYYFAIYNPFFTKKKDCSRERIPIQSFFHFELIKYC